MKEMKNIRSSPEKSMYHTYFQSNFLEKLIY